VVDNSGTVQNHIVYDSFGNITSQSNSSVIFRNSYTGQEFDSESGLFSYGGRYYDPYNGKFIQEDKIGFAAGDTNLSRYVFNSPVIYNDPSGNIAQAVVIPAAVIVFGAIILLDSINKAIEVNQRGSRSIPIAPNFNPFLENEPKGETKPAPPILKPAPKPKLTPETDEERIPFLPPKAPNPDSCECEKSKRENLSKGKVVFFGQKRVDPNFSSQAFQGRPIQDVAEEFRNCQRSPDEIELQVFRYQGRLVSEGTRKLAALSLAGLRPTKTIEIPINQKLRKRINEDPVQGFPRLPSPTIPATRSQTDLRVIFPITIPGY
jgi:RHS repeat-associated protein